MSRTHSWLPAAATSDERFPPSAYEFLFEVLDFTRTRMIKEQGEEIRHVTGQDLLEGMRDMALEQFGLMANAVLKTWNIRKTSDVGEMVFRLVDAGDIQKTPSDKRSDFEDVFDFAEEFEKRHAIAVLSLEG